jgi:hypothetical protein
MRSSFVFYVQVVSDTKSEKTKSKKDEANGQAQSQAKASKGQGGRAVGGLIFHVGLLFWRVVSFFRRGKR